MQRDRWPSPTGSSSTGVVAHAGMAYGQRGWKRQPVGMSMAAGTTPGIEASRSPTTPDCGIAASSPSV